MAELFNNGFEEGNFSAYASSAGSVTVQSTIKYAGTFAAHVNAISSAVGEWRTALNHADMYLRFRFYLVADIVGINADQIFLEVDAGNAVVMFTVRLRGDGMTDPRHLDIMDGNQSTLIATGTTALQLAVWHQIDINYIKSTKTVAVLIDGAPDSTGVVSTGTENVGRHCFGKVVNQSFGTVDAYYDDIIIRDDPFPTALSVLAAETMTVGDTRRQIG